MIKTLSGIVDGTGSGCGWQIIVGLVGLFALSWLCGYQNVVGFFAGLFN